MNTLLVKWRFSSQKLDAALFGFGGGNDISSSDVQFTIRVLFLFLVAAFGLDGLCHGCFVGFGTVSVGASGRKASPRSPDASAVQRCRIGSASSAIAAASELGAEHISVIVRTPQKAFYLETVGQECGVNVSVHSFDQMSEIAAIDVAISTLPGDVEQSLESLPRTSRATLLDVAYNPWPSARGTQWSAAGGEVVSGLRMLAHQALIQVRIFVGGSPFDVLPDESDVKSAMFASVGLESL